MDTSPLGIVIASRYSQFLYANKAQLDLYGCSSLEELNKLPRLQRMTAKTYDQYIDRKNKRQRGEPIPDTFEMEIIRTNGEIRNIRTIIKEVIWEGQKHDQIISIDITEQKKAEEALIKSEEKYRLLAEYASDLIWTIDFETKRFSFVSPSIEKMTGYTAAEAGEMSLEQILTQDSFQIATASLAEARDIETADNDNPRAENLLLLEMIHKNGQVIPTETRVSLIIDTTGKPVGSFGISRDITERKQAENALKASEEKYRLLIENANESIIVIQNRIIKFANPKSFQLIGYNFNELNSKLFSDFIHPDDRDLVTKRYFARLNQVDVPPIYEFRIIDKTGNSRWVQINAIRIIWENMPATLNFISDVTERKIAELALTESEQNFRNSLDSSPLGILIADKDRTFIYANKTQLDLWGYASLEELNNTP
jgi:PAS domain S-box-containing protein